MSKKMIGVPLEGFAQLCREAAAQGAVLLRNEENTLPVEDGECVSVFGRIQKDYYRSGTGSGGAVNVPYTTNLLDSLRQCENIRVNEELAGVYGCRRILLTTAEEDGRRNPGTRRKCR